ncbi:hypothetical protein LTS08_002909 [Lithohypha guttulata]|uniref:Phosphoserine phosphatase n=1 Tax=Lithohypha guttulata TaxID=1690604 RepID=A0AAN7SZQ7_9EURO|nr:hypothetical protein LTR05_004913 [Lithohypha guttulata]KAK5103494.1 hypothetical protein LTS08_002909 [Lithohypha guttulata]
MPFPNTLNEKPKVIFFTDFDGTITMQDTNDYITDNHGFGLQQRRAGNKLILDGVDSFRDGFQKMIDSWKVSLTEMIAILEQNISLDPHFREFVLWAKEHKVPIIVLSSGMVPVIAALLNKLLGEDLMKDIEIIANEAEPIPPLNDLGKVKGWNIKFHDDSSFGHDKSLTIRPYANAIAAMPEEDSKPTLLYAGDGVSDLSAARETDLLFAKEGHDLIVYCEREGIPFTTFKDWSSILQETKEIWSGAKSVRNVAEEGLQRHRTNSMEMQRRPPTNVFNRKMSLSQEQRPTGIE